MVEDVYDYSIRIGELDFDVTGSYVIKDNNDVDISHDDVFIRVTKDHEEIEINGEIILTSLDAWGVLEDEITLKIKYSIENNNVISINDVDEEDILGDY